MSVGPFWCDLRPSHARELGRPCLLGERYVFWRWLWHSVKLVSRVRLDEWFDDALDVCAVDPPVQIRVKMRGCTPSLVEVVHVVV